ncbi:MAG TPA: ATPase, T2SS/T4P/T4SS family [Castellaniella sp.]|uniref:ATPase, T2SS/T4P/T4SS family n=1 Tax=Castellaniella sp. TaxID=1955812 RepID=UPI002EE15696
MNLESESVLDTTCPSVHLVLCFEDGHRVQQSRALPLLIGRDPGCDLVLKAWRVARRHARLVWRQGEVWVEDLGALTGTSVNGQRVASYGPLLPHDELIVGPCLLQVTLTEVPGSEIRAARSSVHGRGMTPGSSEGMAESHVPEEADVAPLLSGGALHEGPALHLSRSWGSVHRRRLHEALIAALQLRRRDIAQMSDAALRAEATVVLSGLIEADQELPSDLDRVSLVAGLVDEAVGLGPLESMLADPAVTEIMVNRHDEIFVEKAGQLARVPASFSSEQAVLGVIERIVSPLGRRIDDSAPMVDARLPDGSRVNAVIAPVALRGASLTIRKFPVRRLELSDLLEVGALDEAMARFLTHCVIYRKNLIVSGGTGSGKTSLLNVLSNAIPPGERIITIEDAAELRLNHVHLVSLEARPANLEGRGRIDIRDLVRNALRMRPDRIVVGECRGGEAFDMLAAMNTGHEGSLTTLHANSPRDALSRLETMILMAGLDLPLGAVREHIASSVDVIVQLVRAADGRRLISAIVEVTGMESGRIQLQELFLAECGPPAVFVGCGLLPGRFKEAAMPDVSWFMQRTVIDGRATLPLG